MNMYRNYINDILYVVFRGTENGPKGERGPKGAKGEKGEGPFVPPGPRGIN